MFTWEMVTSIKKTCCLEFRVKNQPQLMVPKRDMSTKIRPSLYFQRGWHCFSVHEYPPMLHKAFSEGFLTTVPWYSNALRWGRGWGRALPMIMHSVNGSISIASLSFAMSTSERGENCFLNLKVEPWKMRFLLETVGNHKFLWSSLVFEADGK